MGEWNQRAIIKSFQFWTGGLISLTKTERFAIKISKMGVLLIDRPKILKAHSNMGFFNALRNVPWKQYQGTQWRLNFIRSGLNFNAATQIFTYTKARSSDRAFLLPEIL